ncbi:hypothetical protein [Amycolatopsis cihanbeyliensis]|uniref:DUF4350 domain-containing protein n=1 Tax=Amycolatopsis cihanbeyliensis TaxID=1128664 RepID=A0A542DNQ8_AMYCI|nr:hypothetical protein [Amycolatopsis cihanbeyliensis]TQJ04730.1 hypothetical protein FB471_4538 [Amycolatopsis cihanbeyliensis]
MRRTALALVAVLVVLVPAPAAAQQRELPPKLDVGAATQALSEQRIHRAPGAVARFDEELIRAELTPDMRLLVSPYTGPYEQGAHYASGEEYREQVYQPLRDWAEGSGHTLIEVAGIGIRSYGGVAAGPADLGELRQQTAYLDVTEGLWSLIRHAKGGNTGVAYPHDAVIAPTSDQLATLTARLRETRVYNAPGRADPVELPLEGIEQRTGLTLRVAAFPALDRGRPLVDYAHALATEFPRDVVLVAHGRWLDVAVSGPDQGKLVSARDYAFGRFENASFRQGSPMSDRIGSVLTRFDRLSTERAFSRPQPAPFDLRQRVSALAPWVLLGSALLLGVPSLLAWHRRRAEWVRAERVNLRVASAEAVTEITELSTLVTQAQRGGEEAGAAAERHGTAADMFERARTADAMHEVRKIAAEGKRILRGGGS